MEKKTKEVVSFVIEQMVDTPTARSAVSYISPKCIVRATRHMYGPIGKKRILKSSNELLVVAIGKPNFKERAFIRSWKKKTGEAYPRVGQKKSVWFSYPPKRKK